MKINRKTKLDSEIPTASMPDIIFMLLHFCTNQHHISMYVSSKVNPDLSPMLDFYITKELGIKSDKQIMEEYECFFNSESLQNCN